MHVHVEMGKKKMSAVPAVKAAEVCSYYATHQRV
jgi:hypothetical protein